MGIAPGDYRTEVQLDHLAQQLARSAAELEAGQASHIGEYLGALAEDDVAITAGFAAAQPGYGGWKWSVTLAVLLADHPTVSEVVLLPAAGALLAPTWIPWDQRIRPGDVGVGDLLPPVVDDPRVVPAYLQSDDPAVEELAREVGFGRVRVLSREGRVDFAERLHDGSFGPTDDIAVAAPGHCVTCAFYLPLAGSLGGLLGGCGNEFSPADARIVDAGYGCGAHSETVIDMPARSAAADTVIDELSLEIHGRAGHTPPVQAGPAAGSETLGPETAGSDSAGSDLGELELVDLDLVEARAAADELAEAELVDAPADELDPAIDRLAVTADDFDAPAEESNLPGGEILPINDDLGRPDPATEEG